MLKDRGVESRGGVKARDGVAERDGVNDRVGVNDRGGVMERAALPNPIAATTGADLGGVIERAMPAKGAAGADSIDGATTWKPTGVLLARGVLPP